MLIERLVVLNVEERRCWQVPIDFVCVIDGSRDPGEK